MRVEKNDDGSAWIFETVRNLAAHYYAGRRLYLAGQEFRWSEHDDGHPLVASAEDFFGETELDFAEEYLLLHGDDGGIVSRSRSRHPRRRNARRKGI